MTIPRVALTADHTEFFSYTASSGYRCPSWFGPCDPSGRSKIWCRYGSAAAVDNIKMVFRGSGQEILAAEAFGVVDSYQPPYSLF